MGKTKDTQLLIWSLNLMCLTAISLRWRTTWTIKGPISGLLAAGALMALDLRSFRPADSIRWGPMWTIYFFLRGFGMTGWIPNWRWRRRADRPQQDQEKLLLKTLRDNKDTEYGRQWRLGEVLDREGYRLAHPITEYSHYRDMVQRIADGEANVLTKDDVVFLAMTSGTTGKHKMFPLTSSYASLIGSSFSNFMYLYWPLFHAMKWRWEFRLLAAPRKSPAGIPQGGASMLWARPNATNLVPEVAYELTQEVPCFYAQALFVLAEPELGNIDGFSSDLLYAFFKFVEKNMDRLCHDISSGRIHTNPEVPIDEAIRKKLEYWMSPAPHRAAQIKEEMEKGIVGFARRIWPDLNYVFMAKSGSFAHAYRILSETFLKGTSIITMLHGSTECVTGMNTDIDKPEQDVYTMVTDVCFLEFIPLEKVDDPQPETLFMDQLKLGESYEVVTTNRQGLYRYRVGDIIKVVDFYKAIPKYVFQYRVGQRLNVAFERTPENHVYDALQRHVTKLPPGVALVDYTSTESVVLEGITGERSIDTKYILFMEISPENFEINQHKDFAADVDETLCELHEPYQAFRQKGTIAPLSIIQVKLGTFNKLKHALWGQFTNMQFKMPRVQRRPALLNVLLENRLSPASPTLAT